jgi:hypothetical protein
VELKAMPPQRRESVKSQILRICREPDQAQHCLKKESISTSPDVGITVSQMLQSQTQDVLLKVFILTVKQEYLQGGAKDMYSGCFSMHQMRGRKKQIEIFDPAF